MARVRRGRPGTPGDSRAGPRESAIFLSSQHEVQKKGDRPGDLTWSVSRFALLWDARMMVLEMDRKEGQWPAVLGTSDF